MRKSLLSLALAALAAFTLLIPAVGQANEPPPDADFCGLYTADSFTDPDIADFNGETSGEVGLFDTFILYLIVTNISASGGGVGGFEAGITAANGSEVTDSDLAAAGLDFISADDEFAAGYGTPIFADADGNVYLAWVEIEMGSSDVDSLYLGPNSVPSHPGEMVYTDSANPAIVIDMTASSGDNARPVFGINTGPLGIVPREEQSWTDVKNLYR
jgi:hypothetical protein